MNEWLLIGLMALVTYLPRYLPMALAGRVGLPPLLERGLDFVPIAVLSAIIAQASLIRGGELLFSWTNFHALAALAAFVTAALSGRLFLTIGVGLACFVGLKLVFGG